MARFKVKTIRTLVLLPLREYVYLGLRIYQRRTQVTGTQYVPRNMPVILAGNHQNALMDPLHILTRLHELPYFVTRADVFKHPAAAAFFRFLRMLPIYRPRDGKHLMMKNEETFNFIAAQLARGRMAGIFPEGIQVEGRKLLPLRKGLARFAFDAWERSGRRDIAIVPVGLTYTSVSEFRADVVLKYGPPIMISEYSGLYDRKPVLAMNRLMEDIHSAMGQLMVHFPHDDADMYENSMQWLLAASTGKPPGLQSPSFRYSFEKQHTQYLNTIRQHHANLWNEWTLALNRWISLADSKKIPFWQPLTGLRTPMWVMLTWPFTWYSVLVHYLPDQFIRHYLLKKVVDPGFLSTVRFVGGLIVLPVWYFILLIILALTGMFTWPVLMVLFFSWPLAGLVHLERWPYLKHNVFRRRLAWLNVREGEWLKQEWNKVHQVWQNLRKEIGR